MDAMKFSLIISLFIVFSYSAAGEVTTLSIITDNTWKSLDFENNGWTSNDYDDSWWESAVERNWNSIETSKMIWYPGEIRPNPTYFRTTFVIDGTEILNGKLNVDPNGGNIYLYINDVPIDKITAPHSNPALIDITSYLKPGKNVIAAKVDISGESDRGWALVGTIRYDKSASGQPVT